MAIFFDIKTIFFTLWGYPMSYIEFFGVVVSGLATWLVARNNVWTWPIAVISVVLFFILFYQIQLYPDMFLQVFFLFTYLLGWWRWTHPRTGEEVAGHYGTQQALRITQMPIRQLAIWMLMSLVATWLLGTFASNLHTLFPILFSKPSAFPYLDSFTTVMSIAGTFLMIEKRIECWYVWLGIDAISTYMYFIKDVKLLGVEYFVFCFIAALGAWNWTQEYRSYKTT
jgi:nicotinamide mononucleotide transporter